MSTAPSNRSRLVSIAVRGLLAGGVLWLLFSLIRPEDVLLSVKQADRMFLLAALLLVPVHLTFRVLRWNMLLHSSGSTESRRKTLKIVLAGYPFSAVTPGELGDVFVRTRFHTPAPRGTIPVLVLLDKAMQGILIVVAGVPSLAFILLRSAGLAVVLLFLLIALVTLLGLRRQALLRSDLASWIARKFSAEHAIEALSDIPIATGLRVLFLAGMTLGVFVTQEFLLLNALTRVSFSTVWIGYWSVISIQMVFPFFLAGLGIRESAHVYFFGLLNVSSADALSASLLLFSVNVLFPSLLGLVVFFSLSNKSTNP